MGKYFAVLDFRNNEIAAVTARWKQNGDYSPVAFIRSTSKGIDKGIIQDLGDAADSVTDMVRKIKKETGNTVHDVYVSISSPTIGVIKSSGDMLLSRYGREISARDIERCIEIGTIIKLPQDKEPLHDIITNFSIDGEHGIKNPLGLEAMKLGVDINIITVDSSMVRNLLKCVSMAGLNSLGVIFSGMAYANRTLTEEDKTNGTVFVNLCKQTSEIMSYKNNVMADCKVLNFGEESLFCSKSGKNTENMDRFLSAINNISNDISAGVIVLTNTSQFSEDIIECFEKTFDVPVKFGSCLSKPFEEIPSDRVGYIGALGMLDYVQSKRKKKAAYGNIFVRAFNKFLSFLDKYF